MKKMNICKIALMLLILILLSIQSAEAADNLWQSRPIQLGASGGNINDSSSLYCCGGTLGSLVQDATGNRYILSNNHVLARTNKGLIDEDIIQPGLIDQNQVCSKDDTDAVADLSKFVNISFTKANKVDAAIAKVRSGEVNTLGSILDIGQVSSSTVLPKLNMPVKKSGRTTCLTYGKVTAVNVTVWVTYDESCGIGSQTAIFTKQIMIGPAGFSAGGDSGSLIVEDCPTSPRAVGLLFAGNSYVTVANPINTVLSSLGVSMVGTTEHCSSGTTGKTGGFAMTAQSQLPPQADQRAIEAVSKIKERNEEAILRIEGVVGMGIGLSETVPGQVVMEVYVKRPVHEMRRVIPEVLEDIPVKIIETGEIIAY